MLEKIKILNKGYRFKPIKTERLLLIKPNLNYTDEYISILEDKRMWRYESLAPKPLNKRNISRFIKKRIIDWKKRCGFSFFIIYNSKLIGSVATNWVYPSSKKTEISYNIAYPFWNKGFGTEAISAYIEWIYLNTHINRIEANFAVSNIGSKKILLKNNFKKEGVKKDATIHNHKTYDSHCYALLRKDWTMKKRKRSKKSYVSEDTKQRL